MSLTFKLLSLAVRTAAKPIGNYIKRQSKEHEGFRSFAIASAQHVHRLDMRMRLGILHDPEAQQRMHDREQRASEEKKRKAEAPTVRSEEEQKKHDEHAARETQEGAEPKKEEKKKVRIRPLSDSRAIELGANFFSEAFIFAVAVSLLLAENYRSRNKESARRDEVAERLDELEIQLDRLRQEHQLPELEALNERIRQSREARERTSWWNPVGWFRRSDPLEDSGAEGVPGVLEGIGGKAGDGKTAAVSLPTTKATDAASPKYEAAKSEPPAPKPPDQLHTVNASTKGR